MIRMQGLWFGLHCFGALRSAHGLFAAGLLLAACSEESPAPTDEDTEEPETGKGGTGGARDGGRDASGQRGSDDDEEDDDHEHSEGDAGHSEDALDSGVVRHDGGHGEASDGGISGLHRCGEPYPKDPRDDTMTGELTRIDLAAGEYELELPKEMLDWLDEHGWVQQHGNWHGVRRWDQGCLRMLPGQTCRSAEELTARGLKRAPIQEGEPGDGEAFMLMHRHMIQGLHQAFPKHGPEIIRGFTEFPTRAGHPENPLPWVQLRWQADQLESVEWMENIDQHLSAFSSEDDYARWVQFGSFGSFGGGIFGGATGGSRPAGGMHIGLHSQWAVVGSPSMLLDNYTNVRNYAFWRLHVWIDDMWERYRQAAGLSNDDPEYQRALIEQCEEMHALDERNLKPTDAGVGRGGRDSGANAETGLFATEVAPILASYCGGSVCHGADSPTLGLVLAGEQPGEVREGLVGRQSVEVSMALVEPGDPEQSWLFRKITGDFDGVDCADGACTKMPPAGTGLKAQEIERIRSWIAAGATAN